MTTRRDFLKLGALWAPTMIAPRVTYSFLCLPEPEPLLVPDEASWLIFENAIRFANESLARAFMVPPDCIYAMISGTRARV